MANDVSTLTAQKRDQAGKGPSHRLRAKGLIPAVCYGPYDKPLHVAVDPEAIKKAIATPHKFNTVIQLQVDGGETRTVLFKDFEKDPVDGHIVHADFLEVRLDKEVLVNVPVVLTGKPEAGRRRRSGCGGRCCGSGRSWCRGSRRSGCSPWRTGRCARCSRRSRRGCSRQGPRRRQGREEIDGATPRRPREPGPEVRGDAAQRRIPRRRGGGPQARRPAGPDALERRAGTGPRRGRAGGGAPAADVHEREGRVGGARRP